MTDRVFVYGTLRREVAGGMHHLLGTDARFVASGWVRGMLIDLGAYPGLVDAAPGEAGDAWVRGELYELGDPDARLPILDAYEGCGPSDPRPHAYERARREVVTDAGAHVTAWVYLYRGPTAERPPIPHGDYLGHRPGQ